VSIIDTERVHTFQDRNRALRRDSRVWPGVSRLLQREHPTWTGAGQARLVVTSKLSRMSLTHFNGFPCYCCDISTAHHIHCHLRFTCCHGDSLTILYVQKNPVVKSPKRPEFVYRHKWLNMKYVHGQSTRHSNQSSALYGVRLLSKKLIVNLLFLIFSGFLSNKSLCHIASIVAHQWESLATQLGFSENEINKFSTGSSTADDRCVAMLETWRLSDDVIKQPATSALENFRHSLKEAHIDNFELTDTIQKEINRLNQPLITRARTVV
jgi:hypothetical protein